MMKIISIFLVILFYTSQTSAALDPTSKPSVEIPAPISSLLTSIANLPEETVTKIRSDLSNIISTLPKGNVLYQIFNGLDSLLDNQKALQNFANNLPALNDFMNGMYNVMKMMNVMTSPSNMPPPPPPPQSYRGSFNNGAFPIPQGMFPFTIPGMLPPMQNMLPGGYPGLPPFDFNKFREFFLSNPFVNTAQEFGGIGIKGTGAALSNAAEIGEAVHENGKNLNEAFFRLLNNPTKQLGNTLETNGQDVQNRAKIRRNQTSRYNKINDAESNS